MYLEKWYADSVENGQVDIRYRANLHLGPLTVGYSGGLRHGRSAASSVSLRGVTLPSVIGGVVHWPVDERREVHTWTGAVERPVELMRCGRAMLSWNPIVLSGMLQVDGRPRQSSGYVERLAINFAPWKLGLKTLKWGRFCGLAHSLVWIEWEGKVPKRLALLNGKEEQLLAVTRANVRTHTAQLVLGKADEIVSEPIGSGALKAARVVKMLSTPHFLNGIETKWLARANLFLDGREVEAGHAVFEEVIWP